MSEANFEQLKAVKEALADALLIEQQIDPMNLDIADTIAMLTQAGQQEDPNLATLMTTIASLLSSNGVLKAANSALQQQVAQKDVLIAQSLQTLEVIVPTNV